MIFLRGGRQIQVCPRAPDTLATPLLGGSNPPPPPPPPEMFRFLFESEGKEVERKKKKGMGVGCKLLIYFWGLRYFQGGLRNFRGGGVEKFFGGRGGRKIFLGGVEKF